MLQVGSAKKGPDMSCDLEGLICPRRKVMNHFDGVRLERLGAYASK